MKRILLIILIGLGVCFYSCQEQKKEKTPEGVTELFVKAFNTGDFTKMFQYSTKKSHFLINDLKKRRTEEEMEIIKGRKIHIQETQVSEQTDTTATCVCKFTVDNAQAEQTWTLKKENGDWKVIIVE